MKGFGFRYETEHMLTEKTGDPVTVEVDVELTEFGLVDDWRVTVLGIDMTDVFDRDKVLDSELQDRVIKETAEYFRDRRIA